MRNRIRPAMILAIALGLLVSPLQARVATPAHAETSAVGSSVAAAGYVSPAFALNFLGTNHTVTFTCTNATPAGAIPAGCYSVMGSANNATLGTTAGIVAATCGAAITPGPGATPVCPYLGTGASATMTINPGAPDVYTLIFSGYVPAPGGVCPAGTGVGATAVTGGQPSPGAISVPGPGGPVSGPGCTFTVSAQKKYFEVTGLVINGGPCGGSLVWSEALKAYYGPVCTITVVAIGTVNVKFVPDCAAELAGLGGPGTEAALAAEFGPGARYICTGNVLGVAGIVASVIGAPVLPIVINPINMGISNGITYGTGGSVYCAGQAGAIYTTTGAPVTLCPLGGGSASISACIDPSGGIQPLICGSFSSGVAAAQPTSTPEPGASWFPWPTAVPVAAAITRIVTYASGWQQVGGPPGTSFQGAQSLYSYDPSSNAYTDEGANASSVSSAAPTCRGYWAYISTPMTVTVSASVKASDSATCTLLPGWNVVGNPFPTSVALPAGVIAFRWNGTAYDQVSSIPPGGAVWIGNLASTSTSLIMVPL